jgi:hypothetical protein
LDVLPHVGQQGRHDAQWRSAARTFSGANLGTEQPNTGFA